MTAENEPNKENNPADSDAAQESQQQPLQGPGDILRQAREAKGLSQREVADELRLRKQIIELLEADDYETFSTPTFIKGYLRAYAKLLDVDEKMLFEAYKAKGYQEVQSTQMQSFSRRKKHQESDNRLMLITYAVIIIVVGLVIWWWQDSGMSSEEPAQSSTVDSQVEETGEVGAIEISSEPRQPDIEPNTEEAVLESEVLSSDTNISTNELGSENNTEAAPEYSEPEVEAQTETNTGSAEASNTRPEQPTEQGDNVEPQGEPALVDQENGTPAQEEPAVEESVASRLIFEFNQECWVKVDDAEGETQAVGVKAAGYTMVVPGEPPFSITMCKPEAATITFDGEDVDMSQFRRERVARFTVPMSE